jgi:hypothetical protein
MHPWPQQWFTKLLDSLCCLLQEQMPQQQLAHHLLRQQSSWRSTSGMSQSSIGYSDIDNPSTQSSTQGADQQQSRGAKGMPLLAGKALWCIGPDNRFRAWLYKLVCRRRWVNRVGPGREHLCASGLGRACVLGVAVQEVEHSSSSVRGHGLGATCLVLHQQQKRVTPTGRHA